MSDLLPDGGEPASASAGRRVPALAVAALMIALFSASLVSLVSGGDVATAGRGTAPVVAKARLEQQAAQMSATQVRTDLAPDSAAAINAAIPLAGGANPAASPFAVAFSSAADRMRALDCLTAAIYYESAFEPTDGQRAVAQVILNRVRHPAYPNTICGVVFEGARRTTGCQFSFACDGSLRRAPAPAYWERARQVAAAALGGYVHAPVGLALNYHANYVVPYWSSSLVKSANVGLHIFYRWRGNNGRAAAFTDAYAGAEPAIAWRGGFGQPLRVPAQLAAAAATRDELAAAAAREAPGTTPAASASVDSFQRAVLRRYEPLQRDTAQAVIAERTGADTTLTTSQRWALTGEGSATSSQQQPLGRRPAPPPELEGVRRRPVENAAPPSEGSALSLL